MSEKTPPDPSKLVAPLQKVPVEATLKEANTKKKPHFALFNRIGARLKGHFISSKGEEEEEKE